MHVYTDIHNKERKKKMYERELTPSIKRRMQNETCYKCGKIGHWSWYCPLNKSSSSSSPDQNLAHRMQTDTCYKCGKVGHWSWYCPLNSSSNDNKSSSNSNKSSSDRLLQHKSVKQFLEGLSQRNTTHNNNLNGINVNDLSDESDDDLLLKIESLTINDDNSQKEKQNDVVLGTSQIADDQLQAANLVSLEEAIETEPFQRDASFAKDTVSPNKSPSSERKLISKEERHIEAALFTQKRLLIDLEKLDPHQNESMIEAAKTTFAMLDLLGFECEKFSNHVWDFIHLSSSIAEIDKSMENSSTLEEHNKFIEEEKVKLACIQDEFIKTEALLKVFNEQKNLLCEEVSRLDAMLREKRNELKCCELEMLKMEANAALEKAKLAL